MKSTLCQVAFAALLAIPLVSFAAPCPSDTLANVIALGSCSIGGSTIMFAPPGGMGEYYAGPYAGSTQLGPSASQVTFTPDANATNPGFTLTGDFNVTGGYACNAVGCGPYGNKETENLGFFTIYAATGEYITGISAALINGHASTDVSYNSAGVAFGLIGEVDAYATATSMLLSNHTDLSATPRSSSEGIINMYSWDYSGDPNSSVGFDAASFHFDVTAIAATPEPSSLLLLASGLAGLFIHRKSA